MRGCREIRVGRTLIGRCLYVDEVVHCMGGNGMAWRMMRTGGGSDRDRDCGRAMNALV